MWPQAVRTDDMVSNALKLAADDRGWSITFVLQNTTTRELRGTVLEPVAAFNLEVRSESGELLPLAQPALDIPGQPRALVLAPGASVQLVTPIHLRFDPKVPPSGGDDPMVWSIRSAPVPVTLRATLAISGMPVTIAEARLVPGDPKH